MKRKALLFALVLAALPVGMTSRASAGVVPTFSVSPTSIIEGGASTLNLRLEKFPDLGEVLNLDFEGSVTLHSGYGPSMTFGIGPPGFITEPDFAHPLTRDFSAAFTYPTAGVFHPSFEVDGFYVILFANGSPTQFDFSFRSSGELNVLAAATPLPAALPLFGTGLGLMGWWRKRRAEMVA